MSLVHAIKVARRNRRKSTLVLPPHVLSFKLALARYIEKHHFGVFYASVKRGETKPSPKHANPGGNFGPDAERFDCYRLCQSLEATRENEWFHFYVSRPDRPAFLLMLDIDLHDDDGFHRSDARDLADLIVQNEFGGQRDRVWVTTSRNGAGAYVYFLAANPVFLRENGDVEDWVSRLREFNSYLRAKYNGVPHGGRVFRAVVDAVKGTPYHDSFARLDRDDLTNRGVLATVPLTGLRAGAVDDDHGKEEIARFTLFLRSWRRLAFSPEYLFRHLPPLVEKVREGGGKTETDMGTAGHPSASAAAGLPGVPISVSVPPPPSSSSSPTAGLDDLDRMNKCCRDLSRTLGRPATAPETLAAYADWHLYRSPEDHDGNRARLAAEAAAWVAKTYDPCKAAGLDVECKVRLVAQHVTQDIRNEIRSRNRSSYTDRELAVVLYTVERSNLSRNKNPDLQDTVPNNSIVAMFARLGIEFEKEPETQRKKLAAMKQALVAAGLIVLTGRHRQGQGTKYKLGHNHPNYVADTV